MPNQEFRSPLCQGGPRRLEVPGVNSGTVTHETFRSPLLKAEYGYSLYLPASYSNSSQVPYPLIVYLHGATGNEISDLKILPLLVKAMEERRLPESVVVFPNGLPWTFYTDESRDPDVGEVPIGQVIRTELMPYLDGMLRLSANPRDRSLMGFSMGGYGVLRWALTTAGFGRCISLDGALADPETMNELQRRSFQYDDGLIARLHAHALVQEAKTPLNSCHYLLIASEPEITAPTARLAALIAERGWGVSFLFRPDIAHHPDVFLDHFQKEVLAFLLT